VDGWRFSTVNGAEIDAKGIASSQMTFSVRVEQWLFSGESYVPCTFYLSLVEL